MKREDTYTIYRSEARGEAVRDARNTSEGKKSFIRMKQKFLPKETAVPSEGNFAHLSGSYRPACKLFALITALLLLGANWNEAWGQYTIHYKNGARQENIPEFEQTVYVPQNGSKDLSIPELLYNDGYDANSITFSQPSYHWYVRWYVLNAAGEMIPISGYNPILEGQNNTISQSTATAEGGNFHYSGTHYSSLEDARSEGGTNTTSLFWYEDFFQNNDLGRTSPAGAAIVRYTDNGDEGNIVYCDISLNRDYERNGEVMTEPTLSKRYKFVIRKADEIRTRINTLSDEEYLQDETIYVPAGARNVNIQMDNTPENYYWGTSNVGEQFSTNDGSTSTKQIIEVGDINQETTVIVSVQTEESGGGFWGGSRESKAIARFRIIPDTNADITKTNSGLITDKEPRHNPLKHVYDPNNPTRDYLYEEIGKADFDRDDVQSQLSATNNMCTTPPTDATQTTYAFFYTDRSSVNMYWTPAQNQYGLYRSANVSGVSKSCNGAQNYNWYNYYSFPENTDKKPYRWFFAESGGGNNEVYDRTYYNRQILNQETGYGFFYYVDASAQSGRIVNIDYDGTLCENTELLVNAWVNNMTSYDNSGLALPNININLIGYKDANDTEGTVLHRYSSGDIGAQGNMDVTVWYQISYPITLTNMNLGQYERYRIEVQNNTLTTNGADYAIDDIRIFRTIPDIHVERFDACDANTLTINTEYNTILGNMGWIADEEVQVSADRPTRFNQYGYGLPTETENGVTKHYYGNIYFAFLEGLEDDEGNITAGEDLTELEWAAKEKLGQDIEPRELTAGSDYRWVRVNRNLTNPSFQSVYSFRVAVPTKERLIIRSEEEALEQEKRWNFQAVIDFNNDNTKKTGTGDVDDNDGWAYGRTDIDDIPDFIDIQRNAEGEYEVVHERGLIMSGGFTADDIVKPENEELYTKLGEELYKYLQIPRIRCPWLDEEGRLCLYEMNVEYTDMMFEGEPYTDANGQQKKASGDYHVMIFSGDQISEYPTPTHVETEAIADGCSLISSFTVYGRIIIRIEADPDVNARACAGTMRKISASLVNHEDGSELEAGYSFDWYMGSLENYKALTIAGKSLQDALVTFRDATKYTGDPYEALENWNATGENATVKEALLELVNSNLLVIDALEFEWNVACAQIVAIPFMKGGEENTLYCFDVQTADVPEYEADVPYLHPGFNNLFKGEVALRLGHPNMAQELAVPLRDDFTITGVEDEDERARRALGIPEAGVDIKLNRVADDYPIVGKAQSFMISETDPDAKLTITLNANAKNILEEGESYELLIPFVQYEDGVQLTNECDGQIVLPVKIVPEYLTWTGKGSVWYNDESSWAFSTKEELYNKSDVTNETKGVYTFSPLYFTKITVSDGKGLTLYDEASQNSIANKTALDFSNMKITEGTTNNIQYDMAVYSTNGGKSVSVEPYYGNLVSEVFFKPNATMLNQHYLDYQKAWVEFTLERNEPYWMASPLRAVYAGDMYAPYATGKQGAVTPAFEEITFSYEDNSPYHRWELPFYQKAWNKAVAYSMIKNPTAGAVADGTNVVGVSAVKSNWSIEYNDVWVPYSIGKGFYMRVDEKKGDAVTVRLPKADTEYTYQQTKAGESLHPVGNRTEAGQLATSLNDATVEVYLTKVNGESATDVEAGEPRHFLVGNPYMTYLNMGEFLKVNGGENGILNNKYWTLANGATTAVVGTPDVPFTGDDRTLGSVSGTVKPMQAFFIEVKPNVTVTDERLKVTFTEAMMSDTEIAATTETKAASFAATNPTLTITAERGETRSVAKLLTSDKAENGYRASEDAVVLLDSELDAPMVYTVAGSRAAQVNAVKKISNIGLGVYNADDDEATLTISGISRMATPLYLYDAATRQSTRLEGDSYELRVSGDSHGRYFLRDAELGDELENTISIYSARPGEVIVSSLRPVKDIRVFALNGSQVRRFSVNTTRYTFTLPAGIYLIQATDGERGQTEKVLVR